MNLRKRLLKYIVEIWKKDIMSPSRRWMEWGLSGRLNLIRTVPITSTRCALQQKCVGTSLETSGGVSAGASGYSALTAMATMRHSAASGLMATPKASPSHAPKII